MSSFLDLGLSRHTVTILTKKGFTEPTPIQAKVIPLLLANTHDVIGQAQTGTGKTAAFGLPLIEKITPKKGKIQAIILTPTRELALQVTAELNSLKGENPLNIVSIYGGQAMREQLRRLQHHGADIIVGTPGRVLDHLKRKTISLAGISYFILDEADEMLNMGFIDDVETILKASPAQKRILMFSATMPPRLLQIAKRNMHAPEFIQVKATLTTALTEQVYFEIPQKERFSSLCRLLDSEEEFYGVVFCRTRSDVDMIAKQLGERGYASSGLHGDIDQKHREKILQRFRSKKINVLVATDVAARGIDVQNLTHVINYALPQNPETYVHRIGRTGRAGKKGIAISFISSGERRQLAQIEHITKTKLKKQSLPNEHDVSKIKSNRTLADIEKIIAHEDLTFFQQMAHDLLQKHKPKDVVMALLKHLQKNK